jgi:LysW-gamma-L-lysine carboxypeptidase
MRNIHTAKAVDAADAADFLETLLSIPSVSGQEDQATAYLVDQMRQLGFAAHCDAVGNAVGTLGDTTTGRNILLLGHIDTVPGDIPVRREGDRLYGRGAVDAKGPLAAFVLAAAQVAAQMAAQLQNVQLTVIGAVEEEQHSRGAHYLADTMAPAECVIIGEPSGWEGITLGYKGALSVNYRLARAAEHTATGSAAPAEEAVAFWNQLTAYATTLNMPSADAKEGVRVQDRSSPRPRFDTLDPTLKAIHTFGDGLEQGVEMDVGLRVPLDLDVPALKKQMQSWCDGAMLSFPYFEPPHRTGKNTPPVRAFLRAIRAEEGRPRFKLKTGTSDMNVVGPAWGCPVIAYGPGDSALDHTPKEHIELSEFQRSIKVLVRALQILTS